MKITLKDLQYIRNAIIDLSNYDKIECGEVSDLEMDKAIEVINAIIEIKIEHGNLNPVGYDYEDEIK